MLYYRYSFVLTKSAVKVQPIFELEKLFGIFY